MDCQVKRHLATIPYYPTQIREDEEFKRLVAILIVISVFVWENRYTFLTLADNINQAFNLARAIRQTWLGWVYHYHLILNPLPYGPG